MLLFVILWHKRKRDTTIVFLLRYYLCFEQIATPTPIVAIQITENHPVWVKIWLLEPIPAAYRGIGTNNNDAPAK